MHAGSPTYVLQIREKQVQMPYVTYINKVALPLLPECRLIPIDRTRRARFKACQWELSRRARLLALWWSSWAKLSCIRTLNFLFSSKRKTDVRKARAQPKKERCDDSISTAKASPNKDMLIALTINFEHLRTLNYCKTDNKLRFFDSNRTFLIHSFPTMQQWRELNE